MAHCINRHNVEGYKSHAIIVSPFQRRKSLSETLERPLRAENRVFLKAPNANEPPHTI